MNYFAHALPFLDDPYFVAGTAVPDWLNVVDRKVRVRGKNARGFVEDADQRVAAVARGVVQHHHDDGWFHTTEAFAALSWRFTAAARDVLTPDDGLRPSFLGHILVEILLDSTLIEDDPRRLDEYYRVVGGVDERLVADAVNHMAPRPAARLAEFVELFCRARFLYDYPDDEKLLRRLNQVIERVKLPALPAAFRAILPAARRDVRQAKHELLSPDGRPDSAASRRTA